MKRAYDCPHIVMAALSAIAEGVKPEGYENTELPSSLTYERIKTLEAAFDADLKEVSKDGVRLYNKAVPGPKFIEAWAKVIESSKKAANRKETGEKKPKAMSANDMTSELNQFQSGLAQLLTKHHAGGAVDMGKITELDIDAYYLDVVKSKLPDLFKSVISEAKKIEKEVQDMLQEEANQKAKDEKRS